MSETVVDKAAELLTPPAEEEQPVAEVAEEEPPPEEEEPIAAEVPSFEPELTDEQRELLEEPDYEAEVDQELAARQPEEEEYEYTAETSDAERRAAVAEKKAAWLEGQRLKENRGRWEGESLKVAPYSEPFLTTIEETTRKGFIRKAREYHDMVAPFVKDKVLGPHEKTKEALRAEIEAEVRAELEAAWGAPTGGPTKITQRRSELERRADEKAAPRGRQPKDLGQIVHGMIYGNEGGEAADAS